MYQFVLQRRQFLSKLVVQLARNGGPFLFARLGDARRKAAKLCLICHGHRWTTRYSACARLSSET